MTDGKLVFEIRPRALVNKGTAIHDISLELGLTGCRLPRRRRDRCRRVSGAERRFSSLEVETLSVGIVSAETHAIVLETADMLIDGVDGCVELLAGVAERLAPSVG